MWWNPLPNGGNAARPLRGAESIAATEQNRDTISPRIYLTFPPAGLWLGEAGASPTLPICQTFAGLPHTVLGRL